jgi:pimeloyl-ACP methyl ester carboxylesterase
VLLHCYTCSLHWWDSLSPELSGDHRVVRIDLLGHGGSEKPKAGYGIDEQARGVAEALAERGIERALVVGHSLGGAVATALAAQSPRLTAGVVLLDEAPDSGFGELSFSAKLGYVPVIGEAISRLADVAPASEVKDEYEQAFAPGFNISGGFDDPDQVVDDLREMTYTAYADIHEASDDYRDESPLDARLAETGLPLLVVFGAEDQIYDVPESLEAYEDVPRVRTKLIPGVGHSPNVEAPEQTANLIADFGDTVFQTTARPPPGRPPSKAKSKKKVSKDSVQKRG